MERRRSLRCASKPLVEVKKEVMEVNQPEKKSRKKSSTQPDSKTPSGKKNQQKSSLNKPTKTPLAEKNLKIKEELSIDPEEDMSNKKNQQNEMSEYEKQIQLNIELRKQMFQEMVGDAKTEFMKTVTPVPNENSKPSRRGFKRKTTDNTETVEPLKMSLRSRNKTLEYSIGNDGEVKPTHLVEAAKAVAKPRNGPLTLSETYVDQESVEDSTKFMEAMIPLLEKEGELEKLPADLRSFMKVLKTFDMREEGVAKVTKARIYSMNWHPSSAKLLLAAGDRDGNIGFWDIDQLEDKHQGVRLFKVHGMPINCLTFDKYNPTRLLSTSYDGFVRCLDLHTNIFDEVYSTKRTKDNWTAYHAQKDPSTLLVSQSNGSVVVVDTRASPAERAQNTIQCFSNSSRSISLHPQDEYQFMVCNRYGEVGIFDLRNTSTIKGDDDEELVSPVVSFPKSAKGVHGAFYSPLTGQYALTTGVDNTIKLYDVRQGTEAECLKTIEHNNFTGRWLTPFKATWHPQREDVFVVGSMEHPRRAEIFGAPHGQLLHTFKGEFLSSVTSVNAFHPSVPIFAGANSSGRVHIFRP